MEYVNLIRLPKAAQIIIQITWRAYLIDEICLICFFHFPVNNISLQTSIPTETYLIRHEVDPFVSLMYKLLHLQT